MSRVILSGTFHQSGVRRRTVINKIKMGSYREEVRFVGYRREARTFIVNHDVFPRLKLSKLEDGEIHVKSLVLSWLQAIF